jgi:hypothetical protein
LNEEHRELFQRKTGEIPDLSTEAFTSGSMAPEYIDPEDETPVASVTSESIDAAVATTDADPAEEQPTSEHPVVPELDAVVDHSEA